MAADSWQLKINGMDTLLKKIKQIPDDSETVINKTLQNESGKTTITAIDIGTPISKKSLTRTHKKHAKGSDEYKIVYENLGFKIRPQKKFNYVKYPDLGIGTSQHNVPRNFMRNGLDRSTPKIRQQLMKAVDQIIKM